MTAPAHVAPPAPEPLVPATAVMGMVTSRIAELHGMVEALEATVTQNICSCRGSQSDLIRELQQVDYLRQALKDMHAILAHCAPMTHWKHDENVPLSNLAALVDMESSLGSLADTEGFAGLPKQTHGDIWL